MRSRNYPNSLIRVLEKDFIRNPKSDYRFVVKSPDSPYPPGMHVEAAMQDWQFEQHLARLYVKKHKKLLDIEHQSC